MQEKDRKRERKIREKRMYIKTCNRDSDSYRKKNRKREVENVFKENKRETIATMS